ncbi:unnamed protein product [Durusdinium trenchii]|uniref:SP-RING-type domain-containing protein n=1 Tax=Durusdinium trenchii TaxID=1381693 RepID=A0ABP0SBB3_9DINO
MHGAEEKALHVEEKQDEEEQLSDHSDAGTNPALSKGVSPEGTPCAVCRRALQPVEQRLRHLPDRPLCNACCFREMDPFRPVQELEHVMYLSVLPGRHLTFDLEVPDLRQWRKDGFEVEIRGLRRRSLAESQSLQQVWPSFLSIEVNGHEVFTTKVPLRGHKRRDLPQSLSANLRRGTNAVEVTAEDERRRDFLLAVVRTLPLKPRDLSRSIPEETYQDCMQRIQALLRESLAQGRAHHGLDGVERVGDERLKLQCPIMLTRPSTLPVRGTECRHFQCIDLDAYLISNFRTKAFNSRWRCPLCSFEIRPKDLRIDTFVQMLLKETEADVEEVLLFPDGSWQKGEPVPQTRTPSTSPSPPRPARNCAVPAAKAPSRRRTNGAVAKAQGAPRRRDKKASESSSPRRDRDEAPPGRGRGTQQSSCDELACESTGPIASPCAEFRARGPPWRGMRRPGARAFLGPEAGCSGTPGSGHCGWAQQKRGC